jgi:hypothetical protein
MLPLIFTLLFLFQNTTDSPIARVHYDGGGDWYGNKTTFKNVFRFYEATFNQKLPLKEATVRLDEQALFSYPMIYISGHGNVLFSNLEVENLRLYLNRGGFLYIDDDFGIDPSIRRELKKVFPKNDFIELPFNHAIFQAPYKFPNGLPKVHEHAGGAPKAFGLFVGDHLVAFYSFNTDISDGCEDEQIHNDPETVRIQALKMATNILAFGLSH